MGGRRRWRARLLERSSSASLGGFPFAREAVFMLDLRSFIRDVPDFPKPGIVFKDITPLLANPSALAFAVEVLCNPFRGQNIQAVVGAESRGFIFGTAIAQALSCGFVPVRKPGKLPAAKMA